MNYLKYIIAAVIIATAFPAFASHSNAQNGQIIIREYYRNWKVQPYIINFNTNHYDRDETKSSCRNTVNSIMSAYFVNSGSDLPNQNFIETKYICLDQNGDKIDAGYYYLIPMHPTKEVSCKLKWHGGSTYSFVDRECNYSTHFKPKRFDKHLRFYIED